MVVLTEQVLGFGKLRFHRYQAVLQVAHFEAQGGQQRVFVEGEARLQPQECLQGGEGGGVVTGFELGQ